MKEHYEVKKITKQGERKVVNIPKNSDFKVGEYVMILRLDPRMEVYNVK